MSLYAFSDWLDLHQLSVPVAQDLIAAYHWGRLDGDLQAAEAAPGSRTAGTALRSRSACYDEIVLPALSAGFRSRHDIADQLARVIFADDGATDANGRPYTLDPGKGLAPIISMSWCEQAQDLVCLAHETAHALQIILSEHAPMPPVARETCAFLGELLLVDHARRHAPGLAQALQDVWNAQNEGYLGGDLDTLSDALQDPQTPYHYRVNYPLARLAAVEMFGQGDGPWLHDLFSSGRDGMRHLPIEAMANRADDIVTDLPPVPCGDAARPALDAYRSLGAMALLDIEDHSAESRKRIADYYAGVAGHLRDGTAFVALNEDRRPFGYASWEGSADGARREHRVAPFGDHRRLQHRLDRHFIGASAIAADDANTEAAS
jgi:hypothetical protein